MGGHLAQDFLATTGRQVGHQSFQAGIFGRKENRHLQAPVAVGDLNGLQLAVFEIEKLSRPIHQGKGLNFSVGQIKRFLGGEFFFEGGFPEAFEIKGIQQN